MPGRRSNNGFARRPRVRAGAHRHRFDDRARDGGGGVAGRAAAGARLPRRRAARRRAAAPTCSRRSTSRALSSRRTSTACRRSFPAASRTAACIGRGACDAKGILAAQVAAAERLRAERRAPGRHAVRCRRGAGQRRRDGGKHDPDTCRFLINGEPTDSRLATATRGSCACGSRQAAAPRTRQRRSRASRRSRSCSMRSCVAFAAVAERARSRGDLLYRRFDRRRRRAERHSAARVRRSDVPHRRIRRRSPRRARERSRRGVDQRGAARAADSHAHRRRFRDPRCFRSRPTCRSWIAGERRCFTVPDRSSLRTPMANSSRSTSCMAPSMAMSVWREAASTRRGDA